MRCYLALPCLLSVAAATPSRIYTIDAERSDVAAKVAFLGIASKTAHFPQVTGGITLSPDDPEAIDLSVRLDARALTAPDPVTLSRLKGPAFFDVSRHPFVTFRGQSMRRRPGSAEALVAGEITARGVTRPATLAVRFAEPPEQTMGKAPMVLDGAVTIDRTDFGMTAYRLIVGRKVAITIRATLVPA